MKSLSRLTLLNLLLIIFLTSCKKDSIFCVNGKGSLQTKSYEVSNFNEVELGISANATIEQGGERKLKIKAQHNIHDNLEVDVANNRLEIDEDKCTRNAKTVEASIITPDLKAIEVSGSGDVKVNDQFKPDNCSAEVSGSGEIDLNVATKNMNSDIKGSGTIILGGSTDNHDIDISGSGDIKAYNLSSKNCNISISGSGDCQVDVANNLKVKITGSGDVRYQGDPNVNTEITGSGDVKKAD